MLCVFVLALLIIMILCIFLINTATCQWNVMGEVLCEPVCMLCFSSLLYKYRINVLFHKLNSSCVSHVK